MSGPWIVGRAHQLVGPGKGRPRGGSPGCVVRALRVGAGLTQREVGEALGVDRTAVSKIESDTREIDFIEWEYLLCRVAGVDW